jgi:hypothetical protein
MKIDSRPGLSWFRSSYCDNNSDACVEIAPREPLVYVRDSKDLSRRSVAIGSTSWSTFLQSVKPVAA